jgi:FAD/FMN-containing dehydrogenase
VRPLIGAHCKARSQARSSSPARPTTSRCASRQSAASTTYGHGPSCCAGPPRTSPRRSRSLGGPGLRRRPAAEDTASQVTPRPAGWLSTSARCALCPSRAAWQRWVPERASATCTTHWTSTASPSPPAAAPPWGIAGLTLGGGLGILGRKYGLTSDQLLAAQIVPADGRVVECDEHHDGDLFWALRGAGGGNFGVVTSLTFNTIPAPAATVFHLIWPHTHAPALIDAWQDWAPAAPDELAASLLMVASGDVERQPLVNLFGAMLGTESDTTELLDELVARVGADPISASHKQMSYGHIKRYLAELGDAMAGDDQFGETLQDESSQQGHPYSKSEFFGRPLPTEAIAALVENLQKGRVAGQSRELDFTPWGGGYNRVPTDATAFVHRDELFLLKHAGVVDPDASTAEREAARRWLARSWASTRPWGSGGVYPNFPDPDLEDWAHAYYGTNFDRLVRVKGRYDPDDFFHFQQSLPSGR